MMGESMEDRVEGPRSASLLFCSDPFTRPAAPMQLFPTETRLKKK